MLEQSVSSRDLATREPNTHMLLYWDDLVPFGKCNLTFLDFLLGWMLVRLTGVFLLNTKRTIKMTMDIGYTYI